MYCEGSSGCSAVVGMPPATTEILPSMSVARDSASSTFSSRTLSLLSTVE